MGDSSYFLIHALSKVPEICSVTMPQLPCLCWSQTTFHNSFDVGGVPILLQDDSRVMYEYIGHSNHVDSLKRANDCTIANCYY